MHTCTLPEEWDTRVGTEFRVIWPWSCPQNMALFDHGFSQKLAEGAKAYYAYFQNSWIRWSRHGAGKRESQREREREREREEICAFILEIYDVWTGLVNG